MRCIVLRRERIIECLMQNRMYQCVWTWADFRRSLLLPMQGELRSIHQSHILRDSFPLSLLSGSVSRHQTNFRQSLRPATPSFSEDGGKKQAWELSIWDPSKFSLNTFWYHYYWTQLTKVGFHLFIYL